MSALSNVEIDNYFRNTKDKKYFQTISRDQVYLIPDGMKAVVNLDSSAGGGTHWIAIDFTNKDNVYYFDSFGFVPSIEIIERFHQINNKSRIKRRLIYNQLDIQSLNSQLCGYYCIYILTHKPFLVAINDLFQNKKLIKEFVKKIRKII